MACGLFAQIGLSTHLFSLLTPVFGAPAAGIAMAGVTAMAIAGRTIVGWLMPFLSDRRRAVCVGYTAQLAGSLAFLCAAGTDVPLLLAGVILFGAGFGNATSLPPLVAQTEFAEGDVQRVVAGQKQRDDRRHGARGHRRQIAQIYRERFAADARERCFRPQKVRSFSQKIGRHHAVAAGRQRQKRSVIPHAQPQLRMRRQALA
jgi:hypothetical protein